MRLKVMRFKFVQLIWLLLGLVVLVCINPVLAAASSNFGSILLLREMTDNNTTHLLLREMMGNSTPQKGAVVLCGGKDSFKQARNTLKWVVTIWPERVLTYAMLGRLEIASGCLNAGKFWLEQGHQRKPDDMMMDLMLGEVYDALGETDAAVRIWRSSPVILEKYIQRGTAASFNHDWTRAEVAFRRAVAIDPYSAAAQWGMGEVFYGQGRFDEAIEIFMMARSLGTPSDAYKVVEFAHVLDMRGRGAEAVHLLDEINVTGILADAIRGNYYRSVGDLNKAVYFLESSVRQSPQNPWSRHALAITYARQGQRESAIAQLQAALEFNPQFQPARDLLGCLSAAADPIQCVTP